jgi:hypothetical protein
MVLLYRRTADRYFEQRLPAVLATFVILSVVVIRARSAIQRSARIRRKVPACCWLGSNIRAPQLEKIWVTKPTGTTMSERWCQDQSGKGTPR